MKIFFSLVDIVKKVKKQATRQEKIFLIHTFNRELVSRLHKALTP